MARSYVDSILDAAAMASRQDTLGDMLNQLPGLIVEQQRYRDQQQKEAERYNEQITFRNTQYQDSLRAQDEQSDLSFLNIGLGLEDPDEQKIYMKTYAPKSERGKNAFEAATKTVAVRNTNKSNISVAFKDLEKNKNEMTFEEYSAELSRIETMAASNSNLQRTFKPTFDRYKVLGEKKQNKELAKELLDIDAFEFTDEQRKEVEEAIALSDNPTKVLADLAINIQSDKLTNDQVAKLANAAAALRNADLDDTADILTRKIEKSEGLLDEGGNDFGLTDAQVEAFKQEGYDNEFILTQEDPDTGETIRYYTNLENKEFREVDENFKLEPQQTGFLGFSFRSPRSMPDSQIKTQLNIINNQNISASSPSYKRAYNMLQQAGRLPDNARQPE